MRKLLLVAAACLSVSAARAQDSETGGGASRALPTPVIAVVDTDVILYQTKAGKSAQAQLARHGQSYQEEIGKREDAMHKEEQEIRSQQTLLSAEAFAARQKSFEAEVAQLQRDVDVRRKIMDLATNEASQKIQSVLISVLREIVTGRGITLVLPKSNAILAATSLDITDEVRARVDRKLPSITLRFSTESSDNP